MNALYAVEPVLRESIDQSVILAPGSEINITRLAGLKNGANSALRVRTSGKSLARTEAWKRGGTLISATREQQLHDVKLESSAEQWFPRSTFSSCIQVDEWETTGQFGVPGACNRVWMCCVGLCPPVLVTVTVCRVGRVLCAAAWSAAAQDQTSQWQLELRRVIYCDIRSHPGRWLRGLAGGATVTITLLQLRLQVEGRLGHQSL